ncbi:MAG: anion transporter [Bacteroidia bacterium]|nr:anion transporter [Bacteroidia bacterium]
MDILPIAIAALTLVGIAAGRFPVLRMNRATIALVGAVAIVLTGGMSFHDAIHAIDFDTIALLFAMMVINVNLRLAGFFSLLASKVLAVARTPRQLLLLVVLSSGSLSALFLNDTIVLMFTPVVLEVLLALRRKPVPYLLGLMMAANVGSAATIVGNPQNMIIGIASGISFLDFVTMLGPPALGGLFLVWGVLLLTCRGEFSAAQLPTVMPLRARIYKPLFRKSMVALALLLAGFVSGMSVAVAALGAASLLLVTRRLKPERVFWELDWSLLVFFAGLFIVTSVLPTGAAGLHLRDAAHGMQLHTLPGLVAVSVLLSNIVSNVPAVLLLSPMISEAADAHILWLGMAMATTFAGNLTLLGSVANLIVAEGAARRGVRIGFLTYIRSGLPVTILTLFLGVLWLTLAG